MDNYDDISKILIDEIKRKGLETIESRLYTSKEIEENIKRFEELNSYLDNLKKFEEESRKAIFNVSFGYEGFIDNVNVY